MVKRFRNVILKVAPIATAIVLLSVGLMAQTAETQGGTTDDSAAEEAAASRHQCLVCHDPEAKTAPAVSLDALRHSPHKDFACTDCHTGMSATEPHTEEQIKNLPKCGNCHPDEEEKYVASVHARPDKVKGDHPTCVKCHGGGNPHAVVIRGTWTRAQKVKVCQDCHSDEARMKKYGATTDVVDSYNNSFHGKALMRFGNLKTAICADCHGIHDVLNPKDPASPTHSTNLAKTCGQAGCHPGAKMNFAMSGAGHLNLRIDKEPFLFGIKLFFLALIVGVNSFLALGVLFDLKRALFLKNLTPVFRAVALTSALSFLFLVWAIIQASFRIPGAMASVGAAIALILASILIGAFRSWDIREIKNQKLYPRMGLSLRIQHLLLIVSFTALVLTGFPLRFPEQGTLRAIYMSMGGMPVMRLVHHSAGILMIAVWLFHIGELVVKWKRVGFSFKSWSMMINKKDIHDFLTTVKFHLGLSKEEPKFGKYTFRSKLDYLAEYWGVPIMGLSGLILWFPVRTGNVLPADAIPIAYVAHSYEAVLALLAVTLWHLYNAIALRQINHFRPQSFLMNPVWITGVLTEEEMAHEHPLELERLRKLESQFGGMEPYPEEVPAEPESPEQSADDPRDTEPPSSSP